MPTNPYSHYALKDLYQAIDLMDRKIAHGRNSESIESAETQESFLRKLSAKRAALVKSALILSDQGVHCDPQFLPRSFVPPAQDEANTVIKSPVVAEETTNKKSLRPRKKRN